MLVSDNYAVSVIPPGASREIRVEPSEADFGVRVNRRALFGVLAFVAVVAVVVAVWLRYASAVPANQLVLAGDARSVVWTVQAPAITYPTPDYSVGIPSSQTAAPTAPKKGAAPTPSALPTVSGEIQRMYVAQGDHVNAGQIIVQYDTTRLKLGVDQAKTAARRAHAEVAVLGKTLDKVVSNQGKLATARGQLATGKAALATGAAALAKAQAAFPAQKAKALQQRAQLVQFRAAAEAGLAHHPDPATAAKLKAQIAKLNAGIAAIDKGLAAAPAAFAKGNAQIATGRAKLATAGSQLSQAASALSRAKKALQNAKKVLSLSTAIQDAAVTLAEVRVAQATIHSPVSGTVTEARNAGTVAMVGAPLARIRPDGPTKIDTYLAPQQLPLVGLGSKASVDYDSNTHGPLMGRVTEIASQAEFPPTSFPTNIVHMTSTTRITVTLDNGGWVPPGTPVDLTISAHATR